MDQETSYVREDPCAPKIDLSPIPLVIKGTSAAGREALQFLDWRWDVAAAKEIAHGREANDQLDVASMRSWLSQNPNLIDREYALGDDIDASLPLIVVPLRHKRGTSPVVLDGWNRLYRAYLLGDEVCPAIVLSSEEERRIRLAGAWDVLDGR